MIATIRRANALGNFDKAVENMMMVFPDPSDAAVMQQAIKFARGAAYRIEFYHNNAEEVPYRTLEQTALPL